MRCAVIYSSITGNTRMVAEAIHEIMPPDCALFSVRNAPSPEAFTVLALGFWARRGKPDDAMLGYMEAVRGLGKTLGLFGTLGAYPDSDHGIRFMENARELCEGNIIAASFACMGRISSKVLEANERRRAAGHNNHPDTPARRARIAEASRHPNDDDLRNAQLAFAPLVKLCCIT